MSSISSSPDPSQSSPAQSNDQRDNSNPGTSSNLYLVTFLATLFLLLFVSCAIVLRSYILRRRYQRRLDEAMAAGMLLAPRTQGSKRKRLGAKPALFDTCLADGGVTWENIKPLSAQPIFVKRKYKDGRVPKDGVIISGPQRIGPGGVLVDAHDPANLDPSSSSSPNRTPGTSTRRSPPRLLSLPWLRSIWNPSLDRRSSMFNRTSNEPVLLPDDMEVALIETDAAAIGDLPSPSSPVSPSSPTTNVPTAQATPPLTYKVRVEMLQVSVLIAMPSPDRTLRKNKNLYHRPTGTTTGVDTDTDTDDDEDDEDENPLPELVFGVTRVNYRQPKGNANNANLKPTTTIRDQASSSAVSLGQQRLGGQQQAL